MKIRNEEVQNNEFSYKKNENLIHMKLLFAIVVFLIIFFLLLTSVIFYYYINDVRLTDDISYKFLHYDLVGIKTKSS